MLSFVFWWEICVCLNIKVGLCLLRRSQSRLTEVQHTHLSLPLPLGTDTHTTHSDPPSHHLPPPPHLVHPVTLSEPNSVLTHTVYSPPCCCVCVRLCTNIVHLSPPTHTRTQNVQCRSGQFLVFGR